MKLFAILFIATTLFANNSNNEDIWDGENYHQNSSIQNEAAKNLMRWVPIKGNESVLDIGCGDGKITAALASQLPEGGVLGVDASPSMIVFAKNAYPKDAYPNLNFFLSCAEDFQIEKAFDLVVSFTALHWAKDHHKIITNVKRSLKNEGIFALTMPLGLPRVLEIVVRETIQDEKWQDYFLEFTTSWNFVLPAFYEALLREEGFSINRFEEVRNTQYFVSLENFRGFIMQWLPHLHTIPPHLKNEFLDHVIAKYLELEPTDDLGRVPMRTCRLEVIATN